MLFVGVPGPHERESVRVVMRVQQIGELRCGVCATLSDLITPNTTRLSRPAVNVAAGIGMRSAMPDRFGFVEVDHPFHAGIDRELITARDCRLGSGIGRGRERIRTDGERPDDVASRDGERDAASGVHDRDPAIGQQPRLRRVSPRFVLRRP